MKYEQSQQDVLTFPQGSGLSAVFCCFIITELDVLPPTAIRKALLDWGFDFLFAGVRSFCLELFRDSVQKPTRFKRSRSEFGLVACYLLPLDILIFYQGN